MSRLPGGCLDDFAKSVVLANRARSSSIVHRRFSIQAKLYLYMLLHVVFVGLQVIGWITWVRFPVNLSRPNHWSAR